MSEKESQILGFPTQVLTRWGLVLILIVTSIGSIIQGGALSGDYSQTNAMVYLPVLLFMYFSVLAIMNLFGMKPNKFEKIVIPIIVVIMIVGMLAAVNLLPKAQNQPNGGGDSATTNSESLLSTNKPSSTDNSRTVDTFVYSQTVLDNANIDALYRNIATSLSIIFLLAFLGFGLYWIAKRQQFDPDIQIHTINEYTKSPFENNNTIIEYYIDASKEIEKMKGSAPNWYSPTFFASHVDESPGPPLSSYFDKLTVIYELARFGRMEMRAEDVNEVKELHHQIIIQVEAILRQKTLKFEVSEESQ